MTNVVIYVVVAAIVLILFFGASTILTASEKSSVIFNSVVKDTETRCDQCLHQFDREIVCSHDSDSKVCIAVRNYYCNMNCTVQLT